MLENNKTSQQIYDEWYARLDLVDQELVQSVDVIEDDDYPFTVVAPLSHAAKERGNYYQSEVGWTVMWRPFPSDEYYQVLKQEQEAKRAEKDRQVEEKLSRQRLEKQRMRAWIQQHLQNYECISGYVKTEDREGVQHHFGTGSFGTGVSFSPKRVFGYDIWEEQYGNARRYWVPTPLAEVRHRQRWEEGVQREGEGKYALYALSRIVSGLDCVGDDLYEWAFKTFGIEHLIEIARTHAPISLGRHPGGDYALASKYYRIPIRMPDRYPSEAFVIGYGDTNCRRGPAQEDVQWERDRRMHGWVPIGEENNPEYSFPTEADIQEGKKLSADYAQFFSDFA